MKQEDDDKYQNNIVITKLYPHIEYELELAELTKKLHRKSNSNTKVILTSSFHVNKSIISRTQYDGFLQKPIHIEEMNSTIKRLLKKTNRETFTRTKALHP